MFGLGMRDKETVKQVRVESGIVISQQNSQQNSVPYESAKYVFISRYYYCHHQVPIYLTLRSGHI
jgi:muramoyltetrapeptide carboxypeptidase LdcA involved in peptidoglycan recycling